MFSLFSDSILRKGLKTRLSFPKQRITSAFTLIELLIVVAIIGTLTAIAVPNFVNAQVRAKVSRARADMRSISTALEAYRINYNSYPCDGDDLPNFNPSDFDTSARLGVLTTPVSYLRNLVHVLKGGLE